MQKKDNEVLHNTIYDDVFRTIVDKMPRLLIPVINEVFHTSYSQDEEIVFLKNEHYSTDGKVVTDTCMVICNHMYHIECQSRPDSHMEIRMIEYDFLVALNNARKIKNEYVMELPRSATLYLRHTKSTPDFLKVTLLIPDARKTKNVRKVTYETPVVKVQKYTKEDIFQKDLIAFLPYYIMRYEKQLPFISKDKEKLQALLNEYEDIRDALSAELKDNKDSTLYIDLIKLILRISDYFLASEEEVKKGVADIMGGKVLQLESERLLAEGGLAMLVTLVKDGTITIHAAAEKAKMTEAEFTQYMNEQTT